MFKIFGRVKGLNVLAVCGAAASWVAFDSACGKSPSEVCDPPLERCLKTCDNTQPPKSSELYRCYQRCYCEHDDCWMREYPSQSTLEERERCWQSYYEHK